MRGASDIDGHWQDWRTRPKNDRKLLYCHRSRVESRAEWLAVNRGHLMPVAEARLYGQSFSHQSLACSYIEKQVSCCQILRRATIYVALPAATYAGSRSAARWERSLYLVLENDHCSPESSNIIRTISVSAARRAHNARFALYYY